MWDYGTSTHLSKTTKSLDTGSSTYKQYKKKENEMKHAMIGNVSVALKENNDGTYEVLVDCGGEEVSVSVMAMPGSEEV